MQLIYDSKHRVSPYGVTNCVRTEHCQGNYSYFIYTIEINRNVEKHLPLLKVLTNCLKIFDEVVDGVVERGWLETDCPPREMRVVLVAESADLPATKAYGQLGHLLVETSNGE